MTNDPERDMNEGLAVIIQEIYVPCNFGDKHACGACVQIGLKKAYEFGFRQGEKTADIRVEALISLKRQKKK